LQHISGYSRIAAGQPSRKNLLLIERDGPKSHKQEFSSFGRFDKRLPKEFVAFWTVNPHAVGTPGNHPSKTAPWGYQRT
jgi:guanyl-specific ribonuclease Sa